jgi:3-oxoadipate enol-lactonase
MFPSEPMPSEVLHHIAADDGCKLACLLEGPADAPVVMLSNSLGTDRTMWSAQIPALTRRYRVLTYDARGHGTSDSPPGAYSIDRLGRDALTLLDAFAVDTVRFCGLSMGGMVGLWLAVRAPERLTRLVVANAAAYSGPPSHWQKRIDMVTKSGMAAVADAVLQRWFTPAFLDHSFARAAPLREMLVNADAGGYAGTCAAMRDTDLRPILPLIRLPTLVIAGAHDGSTPLDKSREIAAGIKPARLLVLDCAHISNVEQAERFNRALIEFLE